MLRRGYCNNNPINYIDPWGLWGIKDHINAGDKGFRRKWAVDYGKEDTGKTHPFIRPWRHFRERESVEKDLLRDIKNGDIRSFERHIHQGQDTFSHYGQGYRWKNLGHIEDSFWNRIAPWGNPDPDDPAAHPEEYNATVEWTREWERRWGERSGKEN